MRIISLNIWGGKAGRGRLLEFFREYAEATDIFCLQEVLSAAHPHIEGHLAGGVAIRNDQLMTRGLQDISMILLDHTPFFRSQFMDNYGLLMLVRKNVRVREEGEVFVHKHKGHVPDGDAGNHARNLQYVTVETTDGPITVMNFHGLWNGQGKGDSADRLEQSEKILKFTKKIQNPFILCGDFNLLPDTESLRKLESSGLRNLVKEFGITSTRTSFYTKPEKFADYVFISRGIDLKHFEVLPHEVSDHAPLLVEVQ